VQETKEETTVVFPPLEGSDQLLANNGQSKRFLKSQDVGSIISEHCTHPKERLEEGRKVNSRTYFCITQSSPSQRLKESIQENFEISWTSAILTYLFQ